MYTNEYVRIKMNTPSTVQQYNFTRRHLVATIGDKRIDKLTLADVDLWWQRLNLERCENTARNYICKLRAVLGYCNLRGVKCLNPDLIPVPKRRDVVPEFLTESEVGRLIEHAPNVRAKFIIAFIYSSGVRLSEFLQLNKTDIVDRSFTVVGKGGKARLCFIDERAEKFMLEYLATRSDNSPALAAGYKTGKRMSITVCRFIIENSAKKSGINKIITPHTLRHSFATNFLRNNGNLRYLSALMGHASMQTTAHYAHVVDNDLKDQYEKFHSF